MKLRYFERRRKETKETLRKLRDFYSSDLNSKARRLVNFRVLGRNGEENPLRSLRRIKGSIDYRAESTFKEVLRRAEEYEALSEGEKQGIRTLQIKNFKLKRRVRKLESGLENWVKAAEPILADIIDKNPREMNGFEYYAYFSGGGMGAGPIYRMIKSNDGVIRFVTFSDYDDKNTMKPEEPNSWTNIPQEVLKNINPKEKDYFSYIGGYTGLEYTFIGHFEFLTELNHERNKIVREIKQRTGIDLKREAYERRKSSG